MNSDTSLEFTGERYLPERRGQIYYEHLHRYAIAARLADGKRVLDIACGEGYGSALLAVSAARVTGVDRDTATIEHARARYGDPFLSFLCAETDDIPLPDESVDLAVSFETIEHVERQKRMLGEIRRVLVPDGRLILSSPNKHVYGGDRSPNPFHVRELAFDELRTVLAEHFERVDFFGQKMAAGSVVFPLDSAPAHSPAWYSGDIKTVAPGFPALDAPVYFIALCGPAGTPPIDLASVFIDADDDVLGDLVAQIATLNHEREQRDAVAHLNGERDDVLRRIAEHERELYRERETVRALRAAADEWMDERVRLARNHLDALAATEARDRKRAREIARIALAEHEALLAMVASRSWRLTRPLRRLASFLRGQRL